MDINYSIDILKKRYQSIIEAIEDKKAELGITREIKVVAVSKTHPVEAIINATEIGILDIGEN
ncbi:MAG: YggS family pyridoxal phosphate-dependent enzyme, partial [Candidatus Kapaibacteriota bacterium]